MSRRQAISGGGGTKKAAPVKGGSTKRSPLKAAGGAFVSSAVRGIPVVGGIAGGVIDAKAAYDEVKAQGGTDRQARAMSGYRGRKQGALNKRAKKTIRNAIKYYKQLNKAMKGIEKMAGKARVPRHGGGGWRPFRRNKRRRW